ncbi:MAG: electron transport complex protein RnfC [Lachnospiraceae bacterium]|jgi:Na+-translocating ferredoxin:NAD+ oxidoreductase RnfC subunit|nr:electron transport complex protein RnfC [Lachnospiraceae bacterium]
MDILDMVREAGVIGSGGAGFPTHVKLKAHAEYILLNGAECEPLLRVDQQIMAVHAEEIIRGLLLGKEVTGAKEAIIGIKEKHHDVIRVLEDKIREIGREDDMRVGILPDVYPAGDEQVLVYELTGRVVPETGIPIMVGCVVMNSETALNVYHASLGKPVTEKYVTVAGDVPNPVTVKVPVGTPLQELFRYAGRENLAGHQVIDGGPMMGSLLKDPNGFVTKKTKGLVVLPADHHLIQKKSREMRSALRLDRAACEQCSMCTDLCPRHLLGHSTVPHKMVRAVAYGAMADEKVTASLTCSQCNLCEYFSCPAGINPKMANVYYMQQLREKGIRHTPKDSFTPETMRPYRMIPSKRLVLRLNIKKYDVSAPMEENPRMDFSRAGIMLDDHVGAPALPTVAVGDSVAAGQKIGEIKEGALGAAVHASISGVVESIENNRIIIRR